MQDLPITNKAILEKVDRKNREQKSKTFLKAMMLIIAYKAT